MAKYSDIKGFTVQTLSTDTVASQAAGGTWASGGTMNTAREECGGAGIQTAALVFGGLLNPPGSPRQRAETEEYNGTAWTEKNDLAQVRTGVMGTGLYNAALAIGGYDGSSNYGNTEIFNGTNWTESGDLWESRILEWICVD